MANKNFTVHHGLDVGPLTIDAATGNLTTTGSVSAGGVVLGADSLLTPAQNTLLDGLDLPTLTSSHLNYVTGVTSSIQTQLTTGAGNLTSHIGDETKHLTSTQNTFLDGVTVTFNKVNFLANVTSDIQDQLSTGAGNLTSHIGDETKHLTSTQNTFLDSVTATSTEVNRLVGVTSGIQDQLDGKLNLTGGTLTGSVNVNAGANISIADAPATATHAVNKAYVDSLISGLNWKNPIEYVNILTDALSTPPVSPGENDAYIVGSSPTGAWAGLAGRIAQWNGTTWLDGGPVAVGTRFGISIATSTSASGPFSGKDNQIATITGGSVGAWTYSYYTPVNGDAVFVANVAAIYFGRSFVYKTSPDGWVEFGGPAAIGAGFGLIYSGSTLHVHMGAGIVELPSDEVGIDLRSDSGLMLTTDGTVPSTATGAQLAVRLNGSTITRAAAGIAVAAAQPQITSVGTLTGLATAGHITTTGTGTYDVGTSGNKFGTFYGVATSALYADLAENYAADAEYAPGTVLEFGGAMEVTASANDASRRVAGVVSTNPAYLMNSDVASEFKAAVALQGRVPCRVVGTVRKGDMMVSAGNGAARAEASPAMGSVIGKALENFDGVEGTIEVVVGRV